MADGTGNVASARKEFVKVPRDLWESLLETVDTLAAEAELKSIRRGLDDLRWGRLISKAAFVRRHPHLAR